MMRRLMTTVVFLFWPASSILAQASFQALGYLPGEGRECYAYGVSADGSVAVGMSSSAGSPPGGMEAYRWTQSAGMTGLGYLPGSDPYSLSLAVSADGSTVVGRDDSAVYSAGIRQAFRWTQGTGMVGLGDLPGGEHISMARGVSADGSVVVGAGNYNGAAPEAFRWENDAMVGLGDLAGGEFFSDAHGVSADGSVVVGASHSDSGFEAFRWENGTMVGLGSLGGQSLANAVSADGAVVVGCYSSPHYAFRWTEETGMQGLGPLPGESLAVSADGSVIVGKYTISGHPTDEAFVWESSAGVRNLKGMLEDDYGLDLSEWTLKEATGVSWDGLTFVGTGFNADGHNAAWIAHIPEPGTLSLLVFGVPAVLRRRLFCARQQTRELQAVI